MGTYLATGILQAIHFRKKDISEKIVKQAIEESLQQEVNLDCYIYKEDEDTMWWQLRSDMFEGNFPEFLEKQFVLYNEKSEHFKKALEEVKKTSTGQEILELAIRGGPHFQLIEHIFDSIDVKIDENFTSRINVNYHLIAFFLDGKIIMECYKNILRYFEKNIRLQNKEYPIVECLKIMITG